MDTFKQYFTEILITPYTMEQVKAKYDVKERQQKYFMTKYPKDQLQENPLDYLEDFGSKYIVSPKSGKYKRRDTMGFDFSNEAGKVSSRVYIDIAFGAEYRVDDMALKPVMSSPLEVMKVMVPLFMDHVSVMKSIFGRTRPLVDGITFSPKEEDEEWDVMKASQTKRGIFYNSMQGMVERVTMRKITVKERLGKIKWTFNKPL